MRRTYSDELPHETEVPELPDVRLHLVLAEPSRLPVETAWAKKSQNEELEEESQKGEEKTHLGERLYASHLSLWTA